MCFCFLPVNSLTPLSLSAPLSSPPPFIFQVCQGGPPVCGGYSPWSTQECPSPQLHLFSMWTEGPLDQTLSHQWGEEQSVTCYHIASFPGSSSVPQFCVSCPCFDWSVMQIYVVVVTAALFVSFTGSSV